MKLIDIIKQHYVGKKIKLYNGNLYPYENYDNKTYVATILDVVEPNTHIERNPDGVVLILQTPYQNDKRVHFDSLQRDIDRYLEKDVI